MNKILFSSKTDEWETPQWLFDKLNKEFHFKLDPCATDENHKCSFYFTKEDDGLKQSWTGYGPVFVNPPYGDIYNWVQKCYKEAQYGETIVLLIPSRTDTKYWHEFIMGSANELRFIRGRLKFNNSKNSAPFPSVIVIWNNIFRLSLFASSIERDDNYYPTIP